MHVRQVSLRAFVYTYLHTYYPVRGYWWYVGTLVGTAPGSWLMGSVSEPGLRQHSPVVLRDFLSTVRIAAGMG